jgi:hypothetical protein
MGYSIFIRLLYSIEGVPYVITTAARKNPHPQPVTERLCGEQSTDSGASEDDTQLKW